MRTYLCVVLALGLALGCGPSKAPESSGGAVKPKPVAREAPKPEAAPAESGPAPEVKKPIRVAFVTNNASDFWKIAEAGTKRAAEELGCEVLFRIPATGTAQEQKNIVEDMVTVGVSGVAISPKDPANQTQMLNDAAAQVNLVTQDSDAPESNRLCYIGTDNYQAGVAAGALLKKTLPDGGKIMLFVGTLDAQNAQDRKKGIEDTIKDSGIEIVDTRTDETDRVRAKQNAMDAMVTHADLACLVGLWSYNGPALISAVKDAGKLGQIQIVCFDEEEDALQGVLDGHIAGTIVQQPYEFGRKSVELLVALAKGDRSMVPEDKRLIIPVVTITKENVGEFWDNLKKLTGKA